MFDWVPLQEDLPAIGEPVLAYGEQANEFPLIAYMGPDYRWYIYENDEWVVGITYWSYIVLPDDEEGVYE